MNAQRILKENIAALLRAHGKTQTDLAFACRGKRDPSWVSKLLREDRRSLPLKHLDKMADFFGREAYELLMPNANVGNRRRVADRRSGADRRHPRPEDRAMLQAGLHIEAVRRAPKLLPGASTRKPPPR